MNNTGSSAPGKPAILLAADLSTRSAGVALYCDGSLAASESWTEDFTHRQRLFRAIPAVCRTAGIHPSEIGAFVAGLGPGSFSGIRMSIAALNAMAQPGGGYAGGIPSGEVIAHRVLPDTDESSVMVIGDARRGKLWRAVFRRTDHDVQTVLPFELQTFETVESEMGSVDHLVTPDWERIGERLAASVQGITTITAGPVLPDAAALAELAFRRLADGRGLAPPVPLYLHPPVFKPPAAPATAS